MSQTLTVTFIGHNSCCRTASYLRLFDGPHFSRTNTLLFLFPHITAIFQSFESLNETIPPSTLPQNKDLLEPWGEKIETWNSEFSLIL